mmetsp:Transcript_120005/g.384314  ORF Transcript_120005/g.384314 Transcript_120005/m.384314 type:complete len:93 (-) Transcript_120005:278-556(-)
MLPHALHPDAWLGSMLPWCSKLGALGVPHPLAGLALPHSPADDPSCIGRALRSILVTVSPLGSIQVLEHARRGPIGSCPQCPDPSASDLAGL